eukprot:9471996-Pyramimonas_sp.AAC.1
MNIHGLFQEAYVVFCKSYNVRVPQEHQGQMLPIVDDVDQTAQNSEGHLPVDHKSDANAQFIKQRKQYMKVGLEFSVCVSAPAKLVVMTMVVEPQQALMQSAIDLAGKAWERKQNARHAYAVQQGLDAKSRRFRVQEAYGVAQETKYKDEVTDLLDGANDAWEALPLASRTSNTRCLAFRLLAFGAAYIYVKLVRPSLNFPNRTCRLAFDSIRDNDMSYVGRMLGMYPRCRFDPWTLKLVELYGDDICTERAVID